MFPSVWLYPRSLKLSPRSVYIFVCIKIMRIIQIVIIRVLITLNRIDGMQYGHVTLMGTFCVSLHLCVFSSVTRINSCFIEKYFSYRIRVENAGYRYIFFDK